MASSSILIHGSYGTLASSSFSTISTIFLSFNSIDTGKMFVDPLCSALSLDGFQTNFFKDHLGGEQMLSLRVLAIRASKIIIVVLSKNYATSGWCLDELVEIVKLYRRKKKLVIPIFYRVDPDDVRHQTGEFGAGFIKHAERIRPEKVEAWKAALTKIGHLSGYQLQIKQGRILEQRLISEIVKMIKNNIIRFLLPHAHLVGLRARKKISESAAPHHPKDIKIGGSASSRHFTREYFSDLSLIKDMHLKSLGTNPLLMSVRVLGLMNPAPVFENIVTLRIGVENLTEVPEESSLPEKVCSLDTDHRSRTVLPESIKSLRFLKNLSFSGCRNMAVLPESNSVRQSSSLLDLTYFKSSILTKLRNRIIRKVGWFIYIYLSGPSSLFMSHAHDDSIHTSSTSSQADEMEGSSTSLSKQKKGRSTLFDIKEGQLVKVPEYKIPKSNFVADDVSFPDVRRLFLRPNLNLSLISLSFFERIPGLKVLDMSNTNIKTLPPWVYTLIKLEELILRNCRTLMEIPPEIGALGKLKVLDLEATNLVSLPVELGDLTKLKRLMVTLYDAGSDRTANEIVAIIPRKTLAKLTQLEELTINVDPQDIWCSAAVETIMEDLPSLRKLKTLKLYLPTTVHFRNLLELKWNNSGLSIYNNLSNFSFIVGPHAQRFISRLPSDLEDEFLKLKKCLKYVNGDDDTSHFAEALQHTNAVYLDRHWSIQKLSIFNLEESNELKFCLLVDCNEMKTIFDGSDFNGGVADKRENRLSLHYLAIHYLESLEVIWNGPGVGCCWQSLEVLVLHMCPNLTTIFTPLVLGDLNNLKEITVEDCPKLTSLITEDSTQLTSKDTLPRLKRLSLLYLPELVSISSGISIGPELANVVIYDCLKLKRLPSLAVCNKELIKIKGESEWWNALEWNEPEWNGGQPDYLHRAFSELDIEGDFMDELVPQYGNSLRLFVEEYDAS